jgi:hypothetical protein
MPHPRADFGHGHRNGFQASRTITIYRHAWDFLSKGAQGDLAANLKALLSLGVSAAYKYVVDQFGVYLWYLCHEVFDDVYRQVIGAVVFEPASFGSSYGGSICFDDVCFHGFRLVFHG